MPQKRDPSLIPLSHDHHHALVRVFEIRRAIAAGADLAPEIARTRDSYEAELRPHFAAEEETLVPALREASALPEPEIAGLVEDHRRLEEMVAALTRGGGDLGAFADLLERHVRSEERRIFPAYQEHVAPGRRAEVGSAILRRLGRGAPSG